jgi:hypothetical protein
VCRGCAAAICGGLNTNPDRLAGLSNGFGTTLDGLTTTNTGSVTGTTTIANGELRTPPAAGGPTTWDRVNLGTTNDAPSGVVVPRDSTVTITNLEGRSNTGGVFVETGSTVNTGTLTVPTGSRVNIGFTGDASNSRVRIDNLDVNGGTVTANGRGRVEFPSTAGGTTRGDLNPAGGVGLAGNTGDLNIVFGVANGDPSASVRTGDRLTTNSNVLGSGNLRVDGTLDANSRRIDPTLDVNTGGTVNLRGSDVRTGDLNINGGRVNIGSSGDNTFFGRIGTCTQGSVIRINVPDVQELRPGTTYTGFNYASNTDHANFQCEVVVGDSRGGTDIPIVGGPVRGGARRLLAVNGGQGTWGQTSLSFTMSGTNDGSSLTPSLFVTIAAAMAALFAVLLA